MNNKILIERTTETGYSEKEYEPKEALTILNKEIENQRTIWIDGSPFFGTTIAQEDIQKCKKSICITNRLIGG